MRRYILCSETPLSREHVFAHWLTQALPEQQLDFRGQDTAIVNFFDDEGVEQPPITREVSQQFPERNTGLRNL